jgi:DNA-binding MarR family transcriptional regulator
MTGRSGHSLAEYQALRAMMEGGTATAAARRLGLTQSAVSRAIAKLEGRLGRTLFEREAGRLRPTEEAVRLVLSKELSLRVECTPPTLPGWKNETLSSTSKPAGKSSAWR